jgi:hypothetical protein
VNFALGLAAGIGQVGGGNASRKLSAPHDKNIVRIRRLSRDIRKARDGDVHRHARRLSAVDRMSEAI